MRSSAAPPGLPSVELRAADGARATVTPHGGHVLSWVPAGTQEEQLYLSPRSGFGAGQAIRGGVPVIFPQFSNRGPLARHGFARTLPWELVHTGAASDGSAQALLRLTDDAQTRAQWPHAFVLELGVRVGGNSLELELSCRNTGTTPLDFACALHTYLQVQDVQHARLEGLGGRPYVDSVDGVQKTQVPAQLEVDGELDRVYLGVDRALCLHQPRAGQPPRSVQITQQGFEDVVVWNPGALRCAALVDMPPDGYRHMLCVEAAMLSRPVTLPVGRRWAGVQRLVLLQPVDDAGEAP